MALDLAQPICATDKRETRRVKACPEFGRSWSKNWAPATRGTNCGPLYRPSTSTVLNSRPRLHLSIRIVSMAILQSPPYCTILEFI